MAFLDGFSDFAFLTLSQAYDNAALSIVLASGEGSKLTGAAPYNLVWWNFAAFPNPVDDPLKEIVRVTARSTDTLTIVRAQGGTSAQNHNSAAAGSYRMARFILKKDMDDIESKLVNLEKSAAIVSVGTNQVITSGVETKLALDSETLDQNGEFTPWNSGAISTTGRYIPTKATLVQVCGSVYWVAGADQNEYRVRIKKNSSTVQEWIARASGATDTQQVFATAMLLAASDVLEFFVLQSTAADRTIANGLDQSFVAIMATGLSQRQ